MKLLLLVLLFPVFSHSQSLIKGHYFPQQEINEALQKAWEENKNALPVNALPKQYTAVQPSGICHLLQQYHYGANPQQANTMKSGGGFLYVGATPHDTLVVTGNWQSSQPVAVINDGVLIFNNANATINGALIVTGHGQVQASNSYLLFPQQYFYQWGLEGDGHGLLHMRNCTLDFNQLATPWSMADSATFNLQNVHFTSSASTIGLNGHANFIVDTANLLGEIVATDTSLLSLKNVDTVIVWHHIQRGAGLTWAFPNGYQLQHYAFGPDSTGVNGLQYSIELDNIAQVHWALMPENLTTVNISNSIIRSVAVIYKGTETGIAQGLVDNSNYVTSPTFFSDRTFQLNNCSVQTWGVYPTDTTYVDITSCILGEIGTSGHGHTSCSSMFADGSGGYFWASGFGFQSASGCGLSCPARAEQGGTGLLGFCSINAATGYAVDSGLLIMVQTPTLSPPIAYDASDIWVGMLPPQTVDSGYTVPLTGSAYILRGPASHLMSFASYYVAYQLSGNTTWTITDSIHTIPVTDGVVAQWNTTGLAAGHYNMQMIIKDNYGDSVTVPSGLNIVIGTPIATDISTAPKANFNIYPNPGTDQLFIETGSVAIMSVNIYNSTGQLVYQSAELQNKIIDVANFTKGIYVLEVLTNNGRFRERWVKM
ncbi:MAG TPA: T9SS type A sorting domain-containing protein [Chitinophagales bacterium]|nr:T9SS type A sorting domain-containing protein [Chitinophagales bacterium]